MKSQRKKAAITVTWQVIFFFIAWFCDMASGQLQYSIFEEIKLGSIVGNIAEDLGLDIKELSFRKFRIDSGHNEQYFSVNLENGNLYVTHRIDRETTCGRAHACVLNFEAVVENPLNIFHVKVEIQDVNDNPPRFNKNIFDIGISESTLPGARLVLGNAQDPDLGSNSLQYYKLNSNNYFTLGEKISLDGSKFAELVLEKSLDRENQSFHELILTAFDGGTPMKTATAFIKIVVNDVNDNLPLFSQEMYEVTLNENAPNNSLVLYLNATDKDEGLNAQITYSFSHISENAQHLFTIDPQNSDIRTRGQLDYEVTESYEMTVEAKDGGGLVSHCKVSIQIIDVNDNVPEIILTSVSTPIPEDSLSGTVIALINVRDRDSGENGEVTCQIMDALPFKLVSSSSSYHKLVTTSTMDRERTSEYNITIQATDKGSPPLSANKTIRLTIKDVNDNPPIFEKRGYIVYVPENNPPGNSIYNIYASDLDLGENSRMIYTIFNNNIEDIKVSSYVSINSVTGVLYAQQSFDYENLREFEILIMAKDSGSPPLSSNVTLRVCITDRNDNSPKILYPSTGVDGTALFEIVPRFSDKGYLVTKVVAVDADSGHNAWLSYHFLHLPEPTYFTIGQHTGEIRTSRNFQDKDSLRQKVVVMVKDNGVPSLSATVQLHLVVAEHFQQVLPEIISQPDTQSNVTVYLVTSIAVISFLFLLTVLFVIISKCRKSNIATPFGTLGKDFYPQIVTGYPSQFNNGTLPLPYSYDVCVALDSSQNEFAYLQPSPKVPTENLIDADDTGTGNGSLKDTLPATNFAQV
ncbi:hypothetical protein FKM82_011933 [Ascaphus truei]